MRAESYWCGVAAGDYNADGFDDLFVTAYGWQRLWRNNGDGTYADASAAIPQGEPTWGSSAAFCDLNLDGALDLYCTTYLDVEVDPPSVCPMPGGYRQCGPGVFAALPDLAFLSDGHGGFVEAAQDIGLVGEGGKGLGVVIFDADADGRADVYVANDGEPNFLFMNRLDASGKTRFLEQARERGAAVSETGRAEAGMGVVAADLTGDGLSDLFLTHFYGEMNRFHRNTGEGWFADDTLESGIGPPSRERLGFGTVPVDFDDDGRLDVFVANGHVVDYGNNWEPYAMRPLFFRNDGGTFTDVSLWSGGYFEGEWVGRGAAAGDLEGDGDLDIVVSHQRSRSAVLLNETAGIHGSVRLRLTGRTSNRSAFGAVVKAEGAGGPIVRERVGGGSYQSSSDAGLHFGLGQAPELAAVTVWWPHGTTQRLGGLAPGEYLVVEGRAPMALPSRSISPEGDAVATELTVTGMSGPMPPDD